MFHRMFHNRFLRQSLPGVVNRLWPGPAARGGKPGRQVTDARAHLAPGAGWPTPTGPPPACAQGARPQQVGPDQRQTQVEAARPDQRPGPFAMLRTGGEASDGWGSTLWLGGVAASPRAHRWPSSSPTRAVAGTGSATHWPGAASRSAAFPRPGARSRPARPAPERLRHRVEVMPRRRPVGRPATRRDRRTRLFAPATGVAAILLARSIGPEPRQVRPSAGLGPGGGGRGFGPPRDGGCPAVAARWPLAGWPPAAANAPTAGVAAPRTFPSGNQVLLEMAARDGCVPLRPTSEAGAGRGKPGRTGSGSPPGWQTRNVAGSAGAPDPAPHTPSRAISWSS